MTTSFFLSHPFTPSHSRNARREKKNWVSLALAPRPTPLRCPAIEA